MKRAHAVCLLVAAALAALVAAAAWERAYLAARSTVPVETRSKARIPPATAIPVWELTEAERADLTNKFKKEFKPAFEKWSMAYEWHIPISPVDFTLAGFRTRLGE